MGRSCRLVTLRCLFVDFNSYFASVEQQDEPRLRGRPVGVVPVLAPTTCCIAASIEAKQHGVRTGIAVWEALKKCPDIMLVEARPARYVELHHQLMNAIQDCIPHDKPASIDEVPCWLIGRERKRGNAEDIARAIKRRITDEFEWIRCYIGIAPNKFLAKTASDMQKPDGLTVIEQDDLPHALHDLELRGLCGIGPSMERRLLAAGITNVPKLCGAPREYLRAAWGSVEGERFWLQLRGFDVPERKTTRGSIGHSHVLGPELRNFAGMRSVLFKMLAKAAMRMRHDRFLAAGLADPDAFRRHRPALRDAHAPERQVCECGTEPYQREIRQQHPVFWRHAEGIRSGCRTHADYLPDDPWSRAGRRQDDPEPADRHPRTSR